MKPTAKWFVVLSILMLMAAPAISVAAATANFRDVVPPVPGSGEAQGDPLETFPTSWASNPLGLAFDYYDPTTVWAFHEADPAPGIWRVDVASPHNATAFTYSKLGGQNTDGGSIRPSDGYIYAADYNGDLVAIDDNVYLFDRSGNTVAFWETDSGLAGTPCSGGEVDVIIDVAVDHQNPGIVYATNAVGQIYALDLSDTSGGSVAPSPCVVLGSYPSPAGIISALGIEYDACNDGYWISDFASANLVLVANDGTFATVLESFPGGGVGGFNTGVTPQADGATPMPVWTVDFTGATVTRVDSGLECAAPTSILAIPTLGSTGLFAIAIALAASAWWMLRRRRSA